MKLAVSLFIGLLLLVAHARAYWYEEAELQLKQCKTPDVTKAKAKDIERYAAPLLRKRIRNIADTYPTKRSRVFNNEEGCLPAI